MKLGKIKSLLTIVCLFMLLSSNTTRTSFFFQATKLATKFFKYPLFFLAGTLAGHDYHKEIGDLTESMLPDAATEFANEEFTVEKRREYIVQFVQYSTQACKKTVGMLKEVLKEVEKNNNNNCFDPITVIV